MVVFSKMGLVKKNEFTDYWSTRQSMNTPWFCMMFSRNRFTKILHAFHIVDKSLIPARHGQLYWPSDRLRLLINYMNSLTFVCTISLLVSISFNQWKLSNYVLQFCYVFLRAKYDSSTKIAGSRHDVVIRLRAPSIYR